MPHAKNPGPVNDAFQTTGLYQIHFNHAFPFPRGVLTKVWRKCRIAQCAPVYEEAVQAVGPIDEIDRR